MSPSLGVRYGLGLLAGDTLLFDCVSRELLSEGCVPRVTSFREVGSGRRLHRDASGYDLNDEVRGSLDALGHFPAPDTL